MRSRVILTTLFVALLCSTHAQAQTTRIFSPAGCTKINGFESTTDLASPSFSLFDGATVSISSTAFGRTEGSAKLNVNFPSLVAYPAIKFFNGTGTWNFNNYGGLLFDLSNPAATPQVVRFAMLDVNGKICNNTITLPPNSQITYRVGTEQLRNSYVDFQLQLLSNPWQTSVRTLYVNCDSAFDRSLVKEIRFFTGPNLPVQFCIDNLRLLPYFDVNAFATGYVDQFGQNAKISFPNKMNAVSELESRKLAENAELAANPGPTSWDKYGGWTGGPNFGKSLFFRTYFDGNRWWLVTPNGTPFFATGLGAVTNRRPSGITGRESMFQWLPDQTGYFSDCYSPTGRVYRDGIIRGTSFDFYWANCKRKYNPSTLLDSWKSQTVRRMRSWGFNTLSPFGASFMHGTAPDVAQLLTGGTDNTISPIDGHWRPMPDVWDERFADSIALNNSSIINSFKWDDKLIGYIVDSEMSWTSYGPVPQYAVVYAAWNTQGGTIRTKSRMVSMMVNKYRTIEALNAAWGTSFRDFAYIQRPVELPSKPNAALLKDCSDMLLDYARRYFSTVRTALKALDPNHLYMGSKITFFIPEVLQAANESCDVISYNAYTLPNTANQPWLNSFTKPAFICEFAGGSQELGLPFGGGNTFLTNAERPNYYRAFMQTATSNPQLVGACWFQYVDAPLSGQDGEGQCTNNGFVDATDTPYADMVAAARNANYLAYNNHNGSTISARP